MTRPTRPGDVAAGAARWCEHTTGEGKACTRLAVVLVTDLAGFTAYVCRDHWHHLHRTTGGAVRAVQIITRRSDDGSAR